MAKAPQFYSPVKILFYDVETSTIDILHRTYSLKVNIQRYDPKNIVRDWVMLGAAWAVNDGAVESVTVTAKDPLNDERVIRKLYKAIEGADILCGHNLALFDQKKFNARAIKYGLDPIEKKPVIDTLKIAKSQFSFTSNKLRYICDYLGIAGKDESPDWDAILDGDAQAIKYMREYNEQDIIATRELYLKLRAWHPNHPDFRKMAPIKDVAGKILNDQCPSCGSMNTSSYGSQLRANNRRVKSMRCTDCGRRFVSKDS